MPITDTKTWQNYVEVNKSDYGKDCVDTARRVMEILDKEPGDFECRKLVCRSSCGLTGFMAGCVAQMVSSVHSRGEEFRRKWNVEMGVQANEHEGILNPAVLIFTEHDWPPLGDSL